MKILRFNDRKYSRDEFQQISAEYSRKVRHATVIAATGSGKTRIAILRLIAMNKHSSDAKALFIVPTIAIKKSVLKAFKAFDIKNTDVICVRTVENRIKKEGMLHYDFLILDEIHNYASKERRCVFTRISRRTTLGLTATIERQDGEHRLIQRHCPIIVNVSLKTALWQEWVNPFVIKNIYVPLTQKEEEEYTKYDNMFSKNFPHFYPQIRGTKENPLQRMFLCLKDINFRKRLARQKGFTEEQMRGIAINCNRGMQGRKKTLYNSVAKMSVAKILGRKLKFRTGVMTFSETIEVAEKMEKILGGKCYHSKEKKRKENLEKFLDGKIKYLHTATALDEGFDIPNLNAIIIIAGKSTSRQMKQRVGRVIRLAQDKGISVIYNLCLVNTQDEKWSLKRFDNIPQECIEHIHWTDLLAEMQ